MKPIVYDNYFWQDDLVRLRGVREGDWELVYPNCFDTPAMRFVQSKLELPFAPNGTKEFMDRFINFGCSDECLMFTVETLDGEYVGGINMHSIDERNGTFGIGMTIDRDHRGKGYGTAAMRILLKYAFFERRLNKYEGWVVEGNVASATMLKKVVCQEEGRRRQHVFMDGRYMDAILFGMTKEDFEAHEKSKANANVEHPTSDSER